MATNEEYPPCPKRLIRADAHPLCNDRTKGYSLRPVRPIDCRRCLGLEPMPTEVATPESSPKPLTVAPPLPALPPQPSGSAAPQPEPPTPPGLIHRAYSYAEALARWTAAGQPVRPEKEVERIFNEHCKKCGWFDPEKQICRGCGCRVAENGVAVLNKIKMATEHCPQDLW
jgi:hypothetical protein